MTLLDEGVIISLASTRQSRGFDTGMDPRSLELSDPGVVALRVVNLVNILQRFRAVLSSPMSLVLPLI